MRHPITGRLGCYLFFPPGLASAPGLNERFVDAAVTVAKRGLHLQVTRFVDDLRVTNIDRLTEEEDAKLLNVKLECFKHNLEALGIQVHTKPGKYILATKAIDWIGWQVDTVLMKVWLTESKQQKGLAMCNKLLQTALTDGRVHARELMSVAGFLNFICGVVKQARPFLRWLYESLASGEVYAAWRSGKRKFNPLVSLSQAALEDLTWWCMALLAPMYRGLHAVGDVVFIWHQRHPHLDHLRKMAWDAGLVMVVYTDASGETGWGASVGNRWLQGTWPSHEASRSINWKVLRAYSLALSTLREEIVNKLVVVRMDNACAVHYVNCGTGRIDELSQLGREIKLQEVRLGVESVAVHVPGKLNITADALSRRP